LATIPIYGKAGPHPRYHIDETSLKNYQSKNHRVER
jgi:hypothetical protein